MLTYCLKCRKNTEIKTKSCKKKDVRIVVSSNCAVSGSKNLRFIKEKEARRIIVSLAKCFINIHFVGPILL